MELGGTDTLSAARVASKASRDRSWFTTWRTWSPPSARGGSRSGWLSAQLHGSGEGQVEPASSPRTQDLNPRALSKRAAMIEAGSGRQQPLLQAQLVPGSLSPAMRSAHSLARSQTCKRARSATSPSRTGCPPTADRRALGESLRAIARPLLAGT